MTSVRGSPRPGLAEMPMLPPGFLPYVPTGTTMQGPEPIEHTGSRTLRGWGPPPLWRQTPGAWGLTTWLWFVIHLAPEHILYCPMHHPVPARDRA